MTYFDYMSKNSGDSAPKKEWKPFEPDTNKTLVQNFEDFAAYWHERAGNFRKGPGHEPYIVHPRKVADIMRRWGFDDQKNSVVMCVASDSANGYISDTIYPGHPMDKNWR